MNTTLFHYKQATYATVTHLCLIGTATARHNAHHRGSAVRPQQSHGARVEFQQSPREHRSHAPGSNSTDHEGPDREQRAPGERKKKHSRFAPRSATARTRQPQTSGGAGLGMTTSQASAAARGWGVPRTGRWLASASSSAKRRLSVPLDDGEAAGEEKRGGWRSLPVHTQVSTAGTGTFGGKGAAPAHGWWRRRRRRSWYLTGGTGG
ncbi:uncharacterized protein K452DRAFT_6566 [Aplosporella prunicola CBS 121167]|uniref:Uncharacterized protein n=1 Tax=Aplosporella prunicola CBS 121167 TaxID=1176127 RepID=A0A6A6BTR9_9PEZI|nr:uncharacterized protein K452DRAFT_6566 [Aplosporella prunicola CBS 121167]KAF2147390.1 hypothetical protein K452DRAFT_6566 [Aplosporella prunicola CBS 121167]